MKLLTDTYKTFKTGAGQLRVGKGTARSTRLWAVEKVFGGAYNLGPCKIYVRYRTFLPNKNHFDYLIYALVAYKKKNSLDPSPTAYKVGT